MAGKWTWTSAVVRRGDTPSTIIITHMDLAIYCHMLERVKERRLPIRKVIRLAKGRHEFVFDDPDDCIEAVQLAFANGTRDTWFAEAQRSLKGLLHEAETRSQSRERPNKG